MIIFLKTEAHFKMKIFENGDSIAVSLFVDWLSLSNTESEANPNNNLMMSRAGLSIQLLTIDGRWWQLSCFLQVVAAAPILLTTLMVPVKVSTTSTQQGAIGRLLIWSIWWYRRCWVDASIPLWESRGRTPPSTPSGPQTRLSLGLGRLRSGCST